MSKTVVIHQPDFLPYLGFFDRLLSADLLVVLDTAQFVNGTSQSWTHRDKIKTPQGERWLSLSLKKAPRDTPIRKIELSNLYDWKRANLRLIQANYQKAAYFGEIMPYLEALYAVHCERMIDFNLKSIIMLMELLNVGAPMILASELDAKGKKNDLLVDILRKVGAVRYLSGMGAQAYFDPIPFNQAGIKVVWQKFIHPEYSQLHGEFIANLSSIDLLFNCGIEKSRNILRGRQ